MYSNNDPVWWHCINHWCIFFKLVIFRKQAAAGCCAIWHDTWCRHLLTLFLKITRHNTNISNKSVSWHHGILQKIFMVRQKVYEKITAVKSLVNDLLLQNFLFPVGHNSRRSNIASNDILLHWEVLARLKTFFVSLHCTLITLFYIYLFISCRNVG